MKINIESSHLQIIKNILCQQIPNTEVWAFGSRVKYTNNYLSDLDLAIVNNPDISISTIAKIKDAFEESDLPFTVDIINYNNVPAHIQEEIKSCYVKLIDPSTAPSGYKQTPIGILPEDWSVEKLGDVFNFKRGPFGSALKKDFFVQSGYKVYEQQNAIYKSIELGNYYIKPEKFKELESFSILTNDFILSCSGTVGEVYQIPENAPLGVINQALLRLRCLTNLDIPFASQFLHSNSFKIKFTGKTHGAAQKNVMSVVELKTLQIPLPPLSEQKKIAEILTTWDDCITKQTKLIEQKEQLKKGLMQVLLTGQVRFKEFIKSTEYQETKIGVLPLDWSVEKLGDVCDFQNGYAFESSSYQLSGIPIVTMASISLNGKFEVVHDKVNYWKYDSTLSKYELNNNDLIISMTDVTPAKNLIGRMALVNDSYDLYYLNQRVGKLISKLANRCYLKELSNSHIWRKFSVLFASLGVQANLSTKDIKNARIPLPSLPEQDKIAEVLTNIDNQITQEKDKLEKLKEQKKGMMQVLLTGQVRCREFVSSPEKEERR